MTSKQTQIYFLNNKSDINLLDSEINAQVSNGSEINPITSRQKIKSICSKLANKYFILIIVKTKTKLKKKILFKLLESSYSSSTIKLSYLWYWNCYFTIK
jgi:hypothetical protein